MLAIAAAAFAVEIPFFFFGIPSGHDVEFHLYSWLEVLSQWKHGILFPRWAALAHFAYGEPRFIFYPPASWTLGALLSGIFPWTFVSSIYIWIVLLAAGVSMFVLARQWFDRRDAIFAAVLYAVNPYHLVIVYWRSAFAELLASCLIPLLLLCVLRVVDGRRRAVIPLALVLAASWLTNAPAAIMIHYSTALLLVWFAWKHRSLRPLYMGAAAVLLGAALSAFYLLPAIYEQRWINISEVISAGSRPADNFLFIHTGDRDHDAFNHIISWVAVLEMAVILAAVAIAKFRLPSQWREAHCELGNVLVTWAAACGVLMFPFTALLWRILPKLQFMQFPWRWLLCLSMIFALFVSAVDMWRQSPTAVQSGSMWGQPPPAVRSSKARLGFPVLRGAVFGIIFLLIALAWTRIQPPWWDTAADLREMQDNIATGAGYEGTDEYTPAGAEPAAIDKDARNVTVDGPARAAIRVLRWDAESKIFTAEMSAPDQLALRLFRYPGWQAEVNGRVVETSAKPDTGQMLVPVEAGTNRVQITFIRTWDRTTSDWISLLTAISLIVWIVRAKVRRN